MSFGLRSYFFALLFLLLTQPSFGQAVTIEEKPDSLKIEIDGKHFTTWCYGTALPKPYFWPILSADGELLTRPLTDIAPEDVDHPHHKGAWISLDEVNGENFWKESSPVVNRKTEVIARAGSVASFRAINEWKTKSGDVVLVESTVYRVHPNRVIVADIELQAGAKDVECHDTKEGFFAVRVATTMRVKVGGQLVNAQGDTGEDGCWGKASPWVDYSGNVNGKTFGYTLFDHPGNFRAGRYHARAYGLFTISPFGEGAYQKAAKTPPVVLKANEPGLKLRYGMYIHAGDAKAAKVAETYQEFLSVPK